LHLLQELLTYLGLNAINSHADHAEAGQPIDSKKPPANPAQLSPRMGNSLHARPFGSRLNGARPGLSVGWAIRMRGSLVGNR
jgi:hypothetical protein